MLDFSDGAHLIALTACYWLVDWLIHRDGIINGFAHWKLSPHHAVWSILLTMSGLAFFWHWKHIPEADVVRLVASSLSAMLTWKAITKDIDVVMGDPKWRERGLLLVSTVLTWFSPAFVFVSLFLLTTPFALWEHHSTLPMRILQATGAFLALSTGNLILPESLLMDSSVLWFLILTIQISHYLITALAKGYLGPRWYSWVTDNSLHHLAATAYSWGWARFIPWHRWLQFIKILKRLEKPMQLSAFTIELLSPLAMLHAYSAIGFCLGWTGFHAGVFVVSGLLFWDWMLADLIIAAALFLLPTHVTTHVFGPWSLLVCVVFMVIFPLRHKLWKPMPLGWWDTPLSQRCHWQAIGESGTVYGVYNNFMCPHERLYGKVHGCFLAPLKGVTYHLGEVWRHQLRDAIRSAGPDLENLEHVRAEYGIEPRDDEMRITHEAYLKRFFYEINQRSRKHVLPRWLRWLKAPGGQIFYWGELPPFSGQEPVTHVRIVYREEYFDGEQLVRLTDQCVLEFTVDESASTLLCKPEPTPKQIDDFLLRFAKGRIIDLPNFGEGYIQGDDGKAITK